MWKPEHRRAADRNHLRYPSDLTDAEWAPVEPLIRPGRHGERKRSVNVRKVPNGILARARSGVSCDEKALRLPAAPSSG
jgi:transposase